MISYADATSRRDADVAAPFAPKARENPNQVAEIKKFG
jgi:hypothetical protein